MRPIVVLLTAALVLTPTLAHATAPPGEGFVVLVLAVVVLGKLLIDAAKRQSAAPKIPSTVSAEPSATKSSTAPGPRRRPLSRTLAVRVVVGLAGPGSGARRA